MQRTGAFLACSRAGDPLPLLTEERTFCITCRNHYHGQLNGSVDRGGNCRPENGCNDKQPELLQSPSSHEDGGANAPRRIHRGVCDRNADEMDQHQDEADGDSSESNRRLNVGGPQNSQNKEHCKNDFARECGGHRVVPWRVNSVSICTEPPCRYVITGCTTACDPQDQPRGEDGANHLRQYIPHSVSRR